MAMVLAGMAPAVKLGINLTRKGISFEKLANALQKAAKAQVTVGVHAKDNGDYEGSKVTVAQVAFWHEFGAPNADLPERSFLRSTVMENREAILAWRKEALLNTLTRGWSTAKGLDLIGLRITEKIRTKMRRGLIEPKLTRRTIESKKAKGQSQRPLIATGQLLRSLSWEVRV